MEEKLEIQGAHANSSIVDETAPIKKNPYKIKGHFTHELSPMTLTLWEPQRKCPKAVPTHLPNHVVWSLTLKCSVKPYVIGPSTKC